MSKTDYTSLKNVDSIKYLGMWIDKKGKYEIHVKNMIDKFRQVMPKLYQIRNFLKITICKSWIESYLRYGIENYGNTSTTWKHKLQKTQNKILKILFKAKS